ncbi:Zinc finger protein 691 [Frankliniella fusca]|uniref:Zinc finger protein 691 n=1 Tax=Frankliniella fusca TaxID=407009 RepID=A0AAE1LG53_9NEOP|nr:Zinc finger protein 691 [Frankliniella fusca]
MGVPLVVWRARIGTFSRNVRSVKGSSGNGPIALERLLLFVFHFTYLLVLLIIGNIELNPGPSLKSCKACGFNANSLSDYLVHLKIHEVDFNFKFICPLPTCHCSFSNYRNLNSHISGHSVSRDEPVRRVAARIKCSVCDEVFLSYPLMLKHFKTHLDQGLSYVCPLINDCSSVRNFSQKAAFSSHLSSCHGGWRQNFGNLFPINEGQESEAEQEFEQHERTASPEGSDVSDVISNDECSDDSDDSDDVVDMPGFDSEGIVSHFAKFYAMLGHLAVPARTVQKVSKRFTATSELLQQSLKHRLRQRLVKENWPEEKILNFLESIFTDDPFYNSHHEDGPGPKLTTIHLRKKYFMKNFKYVAPVGRNLKVNPKDRSAIVQYVPVPKTLEKMLEDVTIQKAIVESFVEPENPDQNVIKNYTDGIVFKKRAVPRKRLDLFIFADGFRVDNPLGSGKKKYKLLGCYLTIGNLKPHQRSRLKSKRLVLLVLEAAMMDVHNGFKKAFRKLVDDVKGLVKSGIVFMDEIIPVRLQFLIGDNLGQHTVGGFLESFSTVHYFCRFCLLTRDEYKEDQTTECPVFRQAERRTPSNYKRALRLAVKNNLESYHGIKEDSIFNEIPHFHVSDPGQPGCLGHDLFIGGVVDVDFASMIQYFISKEWFSLETLNQRVKVFPLLGSDVANGPAPVHPKGKKMGGHALQNWTFLRLFVFFLNDLILDTSDQVWELFLLLKRICELAMAPALTTRQIDEMEELINEYMSDRVILANNYKPKHHYFSHLPELYHQFGPLRALWTMGFEQYHQVFKKIAQASKNFINLPKTLAENHQISQAYQYTGDMFPSEPILPCKPVPLVPDAFGQVISDFIVASNINRNSVVVESVIVEEVLYEVDINWLILEKILEQETYCVGKIKVIVIEGDICKLVVEKHKAVLLKKYGVYRIMKDAIGLTLVSVDNLQDTGTFPSYKLKGKKCIALKNVLL